MTPTTPAPPATAWSDLVEDALLGTNRRSRPDLLDRAAALTVARRAGLRPAPAPEIPAAAPPDTRTPLPPAAARRLASLLADGSAGELLPQWLAATRLRGYAPPSSLLPQLLDTARQRSEIRPDAVAVAGPVGRWLAGLNPEWRFVLRVPVEGPEVNDTTVDPTNSQSLWQEGLFAERVTYLTRLRRRDPAAGLALLRTTWRSERAEDRLLFLDALQEGLGPDDEAFLEAALADRAKNVRATAAELLSTLPGSALAGRMAQRARQAVFLQGQDLVVEPPTGCDAAMQRDGIAAGSPTGRGDRAFWLGEIVAATPLRLWTELIGPPEEVLALSPTPEWARELFDAWARAAVRQHDAAWASALLTIHAAHGATGTPARLVAVLPPDERAEWTAGFLSVQGLADAFQLLVTCPGPWPELLSTTVLDALAEAANGGAYPWSHSGVLGVAERSLPVAAAARVDELAATGSAAWAEVFTRLAGTLRTRNAMLTELGSREPDSREPGGVKLAG
ncbi:hypothetical protein ABH940_002708 [Streptacidiphilus sp. BW17]|uniref:DUF5691 domain-containing protein n=1 Tax=Streptacidiphilus sp. BW17 TaxID=3156274 RepID=UPI003516D223